MREYFQKVVQAIRKGDWVLMLLCLMSGIVVILCNMAAQIINERIDPRMREKAAAETSEVMML